MVVGFSFEREMRQREHQIRDTDHLWLRRISTFSSEKGPRGSENPSRDKKLGTVLIFPIDLKSPKTFVSKLTLLRKVNFVLTSGTSVHVPCPSPSRRVFLEVLVEDRSVKIVELRERKTKFAITIRNHEMCEYIAP